MSRTRHHTYASWGEYRKERDLRRDHDNWKNEALEELEMDSANVYVIINEWEANDEDSLMEIVGGKYFASEDAAWFHLNDIADSYDTTLDIESTSFEVPSDDTYETYYIMELTLHVDA